MKEATDRRDGRGFSLLTFRITDERFGALTPVGRVLRWYCLDELPHLLNVLGGSMALVGPRPLAPSEVMGCPGERRLLVKPGIAGLWQTDRRRGDESAELDLRYVASWSPGLDLQILMKSMVPSYAAACPPDAHRGRPLPDSRPSLRRPGAGG